MSELGAAEDVDATLDLAPGDEISGGSGVARGVIGYLVGLGLAILLTAASFWSVYTHVIYGPAVPIALVTFAVAQMGVHLVFFIHITTAPDNTNNVLALAFGVLIVCIIIFGSLWIMGHLNHNMIPMDAVLKQQR